VTSRKECARFAACNDSHVTYLIWILWFGRHLPLSLTHADRNKRPLCFAMPPLDDWKPPFFYFTCVFREPKTASQICDSS
jgi:hypothetical protein